MIGCVLVLKVIFNLSIDFLGYIVYILFMGYKKWGESMSPKTGRPKAQNPKSNPIHVRLDDETLAVLDDYCKRHEKKRTEGIRDGIMLLSGK